MKMLLCLFYYVAGISLAAAQPIAGNSAYSSNFVDVFSFLGNAGALAKCAGLGAGVYSENKYGLKELNAYTAVAQMPAASGAVGIVVSHYGSSDFTRSLLGLAYGKNLGKISIGARFNYSMARIAGYGNDNAVSFEVGSTWKITEKLQTGLQVSGPRAAVYSFGAGYECSKEVYVSATVSKEEDRPSDVSVGIQYIIDKLLLMLGINASVSSPLFAAGYSWKDIKVLVGGSFHPQLGISTTMGVIFYGRSRKEE